MAHLAELERARRAEQARLDVLRGHGERNRLGQFATPPKLALEMARYAAALWRKRSERVRFLDPALGTGAFYQALRQAFPARAIEEAAGVEVDRDFARAAHALWKDTGLRVIRGDFTRRAAPRADDRFNLVLANPPYVRHHHLTTADKRRLKDAAREHLGLEVSGLAGLYCHFLFLCHRWMDEGGLALWLIPGEFMEVNYGAAVRRYLAEQVTLLRVHRFDPAAVQFDDALVTSAIVVFRKTRPDADHRVEFSHGGSLARPQRHEAVAMSELRGADRWSVWRRRAVRNNRPGTVAPMLGDLFRIQRGLATGANSFFIMPRGEALARGIPEAALKPVLPGPRLLRSTIVEGDRDGWPALPQQLALLDCALAEDEIRARYPRFWAYLQGGMHDGVHDGYLASRRRPWYSQEARQPAPFLCTYMGRPNGAGRTFRFIWNRSGALAANVYLLLYPRPALSQALARDPAAAEAVFRALSELSDDSLIGESRVYGGGLHKLEPSELAALDLSMSPCSASLGLCSASCLAGSSAWHPARP